MCGQTQRKTRRVFLLDVLQLLLWFLPPRNFSHQEFVLIPRLLQNTIQSSPLIFLKLAENTLGEYDLTLWPATLESKQPTFAAPYLFFYSNRFTVNRTDVNNKIKDVPGVAGVFSRWILVSTVLNKNNPLKNGSGIILGMDSAAEQVALLSMESDL